MVAQRGTQRIKGSSKDLSKNWVAISRASISDIKEGTALPICLWISVRGPLILKFLGKV